MTFSKYINNHMLKNVLSRGTPEYCKWHPRVSQHPVGIHCADVFNIMNAM